MIQRKKDIRRLLDPMELKDIRARENREGRPYSDTDMLLDHIELLEERKHRKGGGANQ